VALKVWCVALMFNCMRTISVNAISCCVELMHIAAVAVPCVHDNQPRPPPCERGSSCFAWLGHDYCLTPHTFFKRCSGDRLICCCCRGCLRWCTRALLTGSLSSLQTSS
jgi:hypothetical protein